MISKLPFAYITVGYQNIEVRLVQIGLLEGVYGHFCKKKNYIALCEDQNPPEAANTLIHEVLHAIYTHFDLAAGSAEKDPQEHIVTALANGLTQVFKDNPAFYKWIGERLGHIE